MPLLTVAIPTYRRVSHLEQIIKTLKAEKNQDFVLLICDDNSMDATEETVRKYMSEMPNLIFYKNEENLGYSGNVCKIYELSKTQYVWFLCNDDEVLPGCIDVVINAIHKYRPTVAVFNYSWMDPYGRVLVAGPKKDIVHSGFNTSSDYSAFMRLTFVSIVLVEKRVGVEEITKTRYKDNVFFQLSLGLLLLESKFNFVEISQKILYRKVGYNYGDFFKFYLVDHLKAICDISHPFDKYKFILWSRLGLLTALQLYLSQKIGMYKYNGKPTKETIRNIWKYYKFYSFFILLFPVLKFIIPTILMKCVYFLKLVRIYGYQKAKEVYRSNINRASIDIRETSFTSYR